MKKKFAFILMGEHYIPSEHRACFETEKQITYTYTVKDFEEACSLIKELQEEGVGAVELCGAFGSEKTKKLIDLTQNKVAIGYVIHNPEQDELFNSFFSV